MTILMSWDITLERAMVERAAVSNLHDQLDGSCALGRKMGFQPAPRSGITWFEVYVLNWENTHMVAMPTSRRHQAGIR